MHFTITTFITTMLNLQMLMISLQVLSFIPQLCIARYLIQFYHVVS